MPSLHKGSLSVLACCYARLRMQSRIVHEKQAVDEAAHYDICRTVWSHHDTERLCDGSSLSPYLLGVLAQTFRNYHDGSVGYVVLIKYVSASS